MACHVKGKLAKQIKERMGIAAPRKPRKPRGAKAAKVSPSVFQAACVKHGLPAPVPELVFDPPRKWAFDFSWRFMYRGHANYVALEVEGGVWTQGRHTRGKGFLGDIEKYNRATLLGWKVIRCTPQDVKSGKVFELLKEVLKGILE